MPKAFRFILMFLSSWVLRFLIVILIFYFLSNIKQSA